MKNTIMLKDSITSVTRLMFAEDLAYVDFDERGHKGQYTLKVHCKAGKTISLCFTEYDGAKATHSALNGVMQRQNDPIPENMLPPAEPENAPVEAAQTAEMVVEETLAA